MESISFRCTSCKQGLKVPGDKAGRRIKCTKCGAELTVPDGSQNQVKAGPPPDKAAPDKLGPDGEPVDDKKGYGLFIDPKEEEERRKKLQEKPKKKEQKKAAPITKKVKTILDPELWEKVKAGLQVIMIGVYIWGAATLCLVLLLLFGILSGTEYTDVAEKAMTVQANTPAGEVLVPDMPAFMLGVVTGTAYQGIGKIFYILFVVLTLFQIITMLIGYVMCLQVPDRFGTKGQATALIGFAGVNLILVLVFKLLPVLGVLNYMLVPYALPEVTLSSANFDRLTPIWVFWSGSPFWEMMLNVVCLVMFYGEPVLIGAFLWSIGLSLKEDKVVERGQGVTNLALGVAFTLICFHLMSMTGTSNVAVTVMRVVYALWLFFTIILLVRIPLAITETRVEMQKLLDGAEIKEDKEEAAEEVEDDDEDDRPSQKRKAKARRGRDDDEDEDEDDD